MIFSKPYLQLKKTTCEKRGGPGGWSGGRRHEQSDERRPERSPEGPAAHPRVIFNFTIHREKVKLLSKKVRDTQANPSYSAKNNVAIRMIATFMPNFFYLSFIQLFYML